MPGPWGMTPKSKTPRPSTPAWLWQALCWSTAQRVHGLCSLHSSFYPVTFQTTFPGPSTHNLHPLSSSHFSDSIVNGDSRKEVMCMQ
jgi:hypothetical protein